nr:hypothetical protein [Pandoravirus massiliensis]
MAARDHRAIANGGTDETRASTDNHANNSNNGHRGGFGDGNGDNSSADDDHVIGTEWLLNAASARLAANKGARCPLRVALGALAADIDERLTSTTNLRGSALLAAREAALWLARSTPEILCTLAMCDLCVSWSRALLAGVKPRAAAEAASNGTRLDFNSLTACFAKASVAQKKADDPSALYSVRVYNGRDDVGDQCDQDDGSGNRGDHDCDRDAVGDSDGGGDKAVEYCFANEATYVAYRYFLRRAWEGLAGVPPAWARPMPRDMCGWIESAMRMRDLCLTLPQHRLCLPPQHDTRERNAAASPHTVVYRQEGGRGGRLPCDSGPEPLRRSRPGAPMRSTLERSERHRQRPTTGAASWHVRGVPWQGETQDASSCAAPSRPALRR